jgi:hypothetical protein
MAAINFFANNEQNQAEILAVAKQIQFSQIKDMVFAFGEPHEIKGYTATGSSIPGTLPAVEINGINSLGHMVQVKVVANNDIKHPARAGTFLVYALGRLTGRVQGDRFVSFE